MPDGSGRQHDFQGLPLTFYFFSLLADLLADKMPDCKGGGFRAIPGKCDTVFHQELRQDREIERFTVSTKR
jgi:hypothetical protein